MVKLAAASSKKLQERGSIANGLGGSLAMCIVELKGIGSGGLVVRKCGMLGIGRKFGVALDTLENIPCPAPGISVAAVAVAAVVYIADAVVDSNEMTLAVVAEGLWVDRADVVGGGICLDGGVEECSGVSQSGFDLVFRGCNRLSERWVALGQR